MKRRTFLATGVAADAALGLSQTRSAKPASRLKRNYRLLWDQNHGQEGFYNPPLTAETEAQAHLGFFEGTPVDAYVCALGPDCGYTVAYPTKVPGMEFIVDRLNKGAKVGNVRIWCLAENLRRLWEQGIDPLEVQVKEARRLGIDFWFRLSMNDWHHADHEGNVYRLMGSQFYIDHPEYRIGKEGVKGWPERVAQALQSLQNYAHPQVRQLRLDIMAESCDRYDVDGFLFDFMRVPGYFPFGEEEKHLPLMTEFIRQARAILDRIGTRKGKSIGLAVRIPNTIGGSRRLGMDVPAWVREHLIDILIPSTFFAADLEEDLREWAALTRNTPVRLHPAIEEGYRAGHTAGVRTLSYHPPVLLPLTYDMIRALAARHWSNGADGLYLFNWFGTIVAYDYDPRRVLDDIGDPRRLRYKNKRYVITRTDESFTNCMPHPRQIPARLTAQPLQIRMMVADDLAAAGSRVEAITLHAHLANLTILDKVQVLFNGQHLQCQNPLAPGAYNACLTQWQNYTVPAGRVRTGDNEITFQLVEHNQRLAAELPVEVSDVELAIKYRYPNGEAEPRPPRTGGQT
ncbi:MAG: hypothetical protein ACKV22_18445 [Bryobacteraceae bacterium]